MNVNDLTVEQVNQAIAELRGLVYDRSVFRGEPPNILMYLDFQPPRPVQGQWWRLPDGRVVPDYCGDWAHAGPLFEEMGGDLVSLISARGEDGRISWGVDLMEPGSQNMLHARPTEAIARAYLASRQTEE